MSLDALDARVAALENMAREYSERAQVGDRLSLGVERLADETGGLNAVLTKVDEQQQRLTTLGRDIERVENQAAKKQDVETAAKRISRKQEDFRLRVIKRGVLTGVGIVVLLLIVTAALVEHDARQNEETIRICRERNQGSILVSRYLQEQLGIERDNKFIDDELRKRRVDSLTTLALGFPVVDCNDDGVRE